MSRAETKERASQPLAGRNDAGIHEPSREDAEALIGTVIDGRYEILELVGQGGMGSVYKAEHTGIRRIVALKLLHPGLARVPEVSSRFKREAEAIGRIEHPNCVNVSDFGELDDGSLYLVMEFLEGRSLGDVLADVYRVEPRRTLRILQHVLRGLGHAHKNDIIHRDVKPENVLVVEQDGDPDFAKILDFGIAKLVGSAAKEASGGKLTQAGMAFGTPVYMSPEQAVGNPIDGRADLYAATVMAYEMIVGQPPFNSDDKLEVMTMHTAKPVPPMNSLAPDVAVPPQIEQLLIRGLAKRPSERYANADEYVAAIDAVLADLAEAEQAPGMIMAQHSTPLPGEATTVDHRAVPATGTPGQQGGGQFARAMSSPVHPTGYPLGNGAMEETPPGSSGLGPTQGRPVLDQRRAETHQPMMPAGRQVTRRQVIFAVAGAVVFGIVLAIILSGGDGNLSLAGKAAEKLSQGDPQGAIALLQESPELLAEDAAAQIELGHAHAAQRANKKAIETYRAALELDPERAKDAKLRTTLEVMLDDKKSDESVDAFVLWAQHYNDEAAKAKLVEMATSNENNAVRRKVVETIRERDLAGQVDWVASYSMDLVHEEKCEERQEAVARLRATGDKRAIPALRKAANHRVRRGKKKWRYPNRCLKGDALEAVQYLETLGAPAADDAGPSK